MNDQRSETEDLTFQVSQLGPTVSGSDHKKVSLPLETWPPYSGGLFGYESQRTNKISRVLCLQMEIASLVRFVADSGGGHRTAG